jgi:calpain-7
VISKNIIFPDCYNPAGKYAVRLFFDGKWCKVIIDDFFPLSKYDSLLCSHTTNEGELYVSILEKAYLKVFFPNSIKFI